MVWLHSLLSHVASFILHPSFFSSPIEQEEQKLVSHQMGGSILSTASSSRQSSHSHELEDI